ncbi:Crp/Fnr family transcriptional regulator [Sinomicrobium weinanense]|uniref:Crp/Fnr family transcriptional regulator n=1 Tax=Sinomicrobium weinanense TaxID=2842200 RepID=A0A926Q1Q5_9FLAO|nr:Crp/Fnr family transcriptional regulator [Sinomicrobium weinanense]MBC9795937.1 Crp/Fnr family transcriptional regulator [Sinomicrobium weinanense]MBU3124684.1 Crp/Fnr family transcriptional regulator [Sinomicrobium weinanense]
MNSLVEHIKRYISVNRKEEKVIREHLEPLSLKKKTLLLETGQICQAEYFVVKGCLRMYFIKDNGTEQITRFAIENWWMTDYMSLNDCVPSRFCIETIEDTEVLSLDREAKSSLLQEFPQMERYFRIMLQKACGASQQRERYEYGLSREERYHNFIALLPDFAQRIPQYMLASYLGFTPEYLSEIRKKMR